jgi:hypothetical protein
MLMQVRLDVYVGSKMWIQVQTDVDAGSERS